MNFLKPNLSYRIFAAGQTGPVTGNISFEHVDFIYPHTGIHALKDFSLEVRKGEKIAIIGRTGSGKTTLAQFILRFYDPTKGTIRDGWYKSPAILDLPDFRNQIGYVPQDVFLSVIRLREIYFSDWTVNPGRRQKKRPNMPVLTKRFSQFSSGL